MTDQLQFALGERSADAKFGAGVVVDAPRQAYLRAFFSVGGRRVCHPNGR